MVNKNAIILAAGKGTRMKSKLHKVVHQVCGKTMVEHVLTQLQEAKIENIVTVVGYEADTVKDALGSQVHYALQKQQLGTGHAVMQTEDLLGDLDGETLVVSGDTPLFTAATFNHLCQYHEQRHAAVTILGLLNGSWNKRMLASKSRPFTKSTPGFTALITVSCSQR